VGAIVVAVFQEAVMLYRSDAAAAEGAKYTEGECHVFAAALHRRFGWPIHLVVDHSRPHWEDPADPDNAIPTVVHAVAVDPAGNAWDVSGVRSLDAIKTEVGGWTATSADTLDTANTSAMPPPYRAWIVERRLRSSTNSASRAS
jgi:hypothetical protein